MGRLVTKCGRVGRMLVSTDGRRRYAARRRTGREIDRLRALPRFTETETNLLGPPLFVPDAASFLAMYDEIFERDIYRCEIGGRSPYIIDGGANIGMSAIYFARKYPAAEIVSFEPDPIIFQFLSRNLASFGIANVRLVNKALWTAETQLAFDSDGADGGRAVNTSTAARKVMVEAVPLSRYLDRRVDFLKLDVEGAEGELIADCAPLLANVKQAFVEYHSFADQPQSLHQILATLNGCGFRVHMHPERTSPHPLARRETWGGMDLQLNLFCYRP